MLIFSIMLEHGTAA